MLGIQRKKSYKYNSHQRYNKNTSVDGGSKLFFNNDVGYNSRYYLFISNKYKKKRINSKFNSNIKFEGRGSN